MHPGLKVLVGAFMVVLGIFASLTYSTEILNFTQAVIGPLLVLVGAFIIWLESDEWKLAMQKDTDRGFDIQQRLEAKEKQSKKKEETTESEGNECPVCSKEFDTERGMKIHKAQKHG